MTTPTPEQAAVKTTLPLIQDCTHGNCAFHFPQFEYLDPEKFLENMEWCIDMTKPWCVDKHFIANKDAYSEAIRLLKQDTFESFIKAVELAAHLYYGEGNVWLDKRGRVAIFKPCCR